MRFPATKTNKYKNPTVLSNRTNIKRANTTSTQEKKNRKLNFGPQIASGGSSVGVSNAPFE